MENMSDSIDRKPVEGPASRLLTSLKTGFLSGVFTAGILLKVMIPTMALVWVLKLIGAMDVIARWTSPLMEVFRLPGEASLILITGGLVNIYAAIAVAVNVSLTGQQITVLAIMVLIAHNLIVESAVQSRAGTPVAIMVTVRLAAAVSAGFIFARIVPERGKLVTHAGFQIAEGGWGKVLAGNALSLIKIALIIISLMIVVEIMREYGIMDIITDFLQAPMKILGMDAKSSFVAAVGLLLGIAYGAGIIINETYRSGIEKKEILATNIFLGTNHALVEDSLIFAAVGASLGWIVLGRLLFGALFLRLTLPVVFWLWEPDVKVKEPGTDTR